ncbi:hypothetical protein T440DRAFT_480807 [Plenodomus tracheiphilus IPT5]|uniref:Uncharacterized protein n=1 Tax=Plenodomus tracheiphilus IPT5 TaxID=1408161 RepID=A0A6A7AYV7_9PLEO|nr:hypothetical protein T440DRAFT_480807 [Plenodomus tracheiphilus IPT5]
MTIIMCPASDSKPRAALWDAFVRGVAAGSSGRPCALLKSLAKTFNSAIAQTEESEAAERFFKTSRAKVSCALGVLTTVRSGVAGMGAVACRSPASRKHRPITLRLNFERQVFDVRSSLPSNNCTHRRAECDRAGSAIRCEGDRVHNGDVEATWSR